MKKILSAIVLSLCLAGSAIGQTLPEITYVWDAPTTGSHAATYVVEYSTDGAIWNQFAIVDTTQITIRDLFENNLTYQVRVAGVDILSSQGPYSLPSDPYTVDLGVPGIPGKPIIIEL